MPKTKQKFKIGDKAFYIADKYVSRDTVLGTFLTSHDVIKVVFENPSFRFSEDGSKYEIQETFCVNQDDVFATKEQLIKSIKEEKFEEYD